MTQTTLWLLPLVLGAVFGIGSALKAGIRWSWGILLQHSILLVISVLGLLVFPKYDWLCAYIGWGFLLCYTVLARMMLMSMTQALGLLRCDQAVSKARVLRFLLWGPAGEYWLDLATMINFYLHGDTSSANAIYQKWQDFRLPKAISDSLTAYAMVGLLVMRDWKSTIEKYEDAFQRYKLDQEAKKKDIRFPFQVAVPAVRAFNELGRYKEAAEALVLADLPSSNYGRDSLDTAFLSYFAVLGAQTELNEVLTSMSKSRTALPEHARLYWKARCALELGDYSNAIAVFEDSLSKTPAKDNAWRERTQKQIEQCQELLEQANTRVLDPEREVERAEAAKTGWQIMQRCIAIAEILNSRKPPVAVRVLTGLITISFIICFSPLLLGDRSYLKISEFALRNGPLDGRVLNGEWWRLLSYQFMHGGISHLLMNLFALIWFGKYAENVYGTRLFLLIFFASGVFSGLAQVLVDPSGQAVGASGAILGVFGAGLAATLRFKNVLPKAIRKHELGWMTALAVTQLLFDQIVNFLFPSHEGKEAVRIAAAAHFGGMISGFILGWILPLKKLGTEDKAMPNLPASPAESI